MQDFQQRVIDEKAQLDERLSKLWPFLQGQVFTTLPADEQRRLQAQHGHMTAYSEVLGERIANFG